MATKFHENLGKPVWECQIHLWDKSLNTAETMEVAVVKNRTMKHAQIQSANHHHHTNITVR